MLTRVNSNDLVSMLLCAVRPDACMCIDPLYECVFMYLQMEFYLFDASTDRLEITVFDRDLFSPNGKQFQYTK